MSTDAYNGASNGAPDSNSPARNEPCHCGSGKKFKRCHGADTAPKNTAPKIDWSDMGGFAGQPMGGGPGLPGGMNLAMAAQAQQMMSQFDPALMQQFTGALQKLPRGQLNKLQAIMQAAMSGKDVTAEAQDFEKQLPPDFQELMKGFAGMPGMDMGAMAPAAPVEMPKTPDDARAIIERAVADGRMTREDADKLLK